MNNFYRFACQSNIFVKGMLIVGGASVAANVIHTVYTCCTNKHSKGNGDVDFMKIDKEKKNVLDKLLYGLSWPIAPLTCYVYERLPPTPHLSFDQKLVLLLYGGATVAVIATTYKR